MKRKHILSLSLIAIIFLVAWKYKQNTPDEYIHIKRTDASNIVQILTESYQKTIEQNCITVGDSRAIATPIVQTINYLNAKIADTTTQKKP